MTKLTKDERLSAHLLLRDACEKFDHAWLLQTYGHNSEADYYEGKARESFAKVSSLLSEELEQAA